MRASQSTAALAAAQMMPPSAGKRFQILRVNQAHIAQARRMTVQRCQVCGVCAVIPTTPPSTAGTPHPNKYSCINKKRCLAAQLAMPRMENLVRTTVNSKTPAALKSGHGSSVGAAAGASNSNSSSNNHGNTLLLQTIPANQRASVANLAYQVANSLSSLSRTARITAGDATTQPELFLPFSPFRLGSMSFSTRAATRWHTSAYLVATGIVPHSDSHQGRAVYTDYFFPEALEFFQKTRPIARRFVAKRKARVRFAVTPVLHSAGTTTPPPRPGQDRRCQSAAPTNSPRKRRAPSAGSSSSEPISPQKPSPIKRRRLRASSIRKLHADPTPPGRNATPVGGAGSGFQANLGAPSNTTFAARALLLLATSNAAPSAAAAAAVAVAAVTPHGAASGARAPLPQGPRILGSLVGSGRVTTPRVDPHTR
jgi:hypothetical protein